MQLVEHPRRPACLKDGELVVHPDSLDVDCIVWFSIPDEVEGGPEAEGIPAKRLDGDRVRICAIPFFPYHLGFYDEVQVREQDGSLYAVDVVKAEHFLVVRIFLHEEPISTEKAIDDPQSDDLFWRIIRALSLHKIWFERYSTNYASLLVAPNEWEYVKAFLDLKTKVNELSYELATPMRHNASA